MPNHTDVVTEVVDRLRAIGTLAEHVNEDRVDLHLALESARQLLDIAADHAQLDPY